MSYRKHLDGFTTYDHIIVARICDDLCLQEISTTMSKQKSTAHHLWSNSVISTTLRRLQKLDTWTLRFPLQG